MDSLEEQIRPHTQYWDCYNDCPLEYNHTGEVIKIAEKFAIDFANWCKQEYDVENTAYHNKWIDVDGRFISTEELLIKFKREVYSERNVE